MVGSILGVSATTADGSNCSIYVREATVSTDGWVGVRSQVQVDGGQVIVHDEICWTDMLTYLAVWLAAYTR